MKLSGLLAPLIAAKAPHDQIMAVIVAFEDDRAALLASLVPAGKRLSARQWAKVRSAVLERDNHVCAYCDASADTVDHVVPIVLGGSNEPENLVACCRYCNGSKGSKTLAEWRPVQ